MIAFSLSVCETNFFFLDTPCRFFLDCEALFFPMKTFNVSSGSKEKRLMRVREGFGGSEVHMGESKVLESSTKGGLSVLLIGDGDLLVSKG